MSQENSLFLPVKNHCQGEMVTCRLDETVVNAAIIMRDKRTSCMIVCDDNEVPVGIMTDRDLRSKVVAAGLNPADLKVEEIMTSPVVAVSEKDRFFEVLYQMSRHRIRRVGVVDQQDRLIGMVNETDIIQLQNRSPQQLLNAIDVAETVEELKKLHLDLEELVTFLFHSGVRTYDLVRLISLLHDQTALRLIAILQRDRFPSLPNRFAFLVLGSEGRREQTLKTDQDNAIIYADDLPPDEVGQVEEFSRALIDTLIEIGVPECPGGIMAKNAFWRRNASAWRAAIDGWISAPTGENILNFSMFSDVRTLWGDPSLEQELKAHIVGRAQEKTLFLARMAANVCQFVPPLGLFGGIKVAKKGENAGTIDLKKAGLFALAEGIKILALESGRLGGSTREKLIVLAEEKILEQKQVDDLAAAFNLLCFFRLREQVSAATAGEEPTNTITPESLNRVEKGRLQIALEVVRSFESTLKSHFRVSMLGD